MTNARFSGVRTSASLIARAGLGIALAATGALLAGCGSGSPSSSAPGGTSSSSPAPSTSAQGSGGGTTLFPVAVGETWVYKVTGSLEHGTVTNKITSVVPTATAKKVTITSHGTLGDLPATTTKLTYLFFPDGSIGVPYVAAGNGTVTIKSGSIIWPSQAVLDSGQPHMSKLVLAIKESGQTFNATADVTVKGEGTATITVPAGTYQATLVNETISEKVSGVALSVTVRTWLASSVGPVKSEVLTSSSSAVEISDVLTSYTAS